MPKTSKSKCSHPRAARYYNNITSGNTQNGYACDNCDMEGLEAPVAPAILAPGIYKLAEPVLNAGKDGRSTDWDKLASFPTGTYYVTKSPSITGEGYGCRIERGGYARVNHTHHGYDALVAALVPVEGTNEEFLTFQKIKNSYDGDAEIILAHLLDTGKLTRAEVETAISEIAAKPQED